ncbi:MAG: hypothetical protein Terrestrivirus4_132 [Terrestrivirus sp.]|uniref:Uncharacterized protein n=1 Tax=Terrestrivirus sp. TaxID=2487775 RepID=A0A3G4ZNW5_9VIRU|nr:MAG: hypothetical protein Terrestrivirus4_132 [Terrestrivirus sp.]
MCATKKQICIGILVMVGLIIVASSILAGYNVVTSRYNNCVTTSSENVTCTATCEYHSCILRYQDLTYHCDNCTFPSEITCIYLPYGDSGYDCENKDDTNRMITIKIELWNMIIPNVILSLVLVFCVIYIITSFTCCCKSKKKKQRQNNDDDIDLIEKQ